MSRCLVVSANKLLHVGRHVARAHLVQATACRWPESMLSRGGGAYAILVRSVSATGESNTPAQLRNTAVAADQPTPSFLEGLGHGYADHLRWLAQKDVLGQDMFLLGPPGPERRRLVMAYCQLTGKTFEYVQLSRDTTEAGEHARFFFPALQL